MSIKPRFRLIRADDQLEILITLERVRLSEGPGKQHQLVADLRDGGLPTSGQVTITLPPQHLVEWATPGQTKPIFGRSTTVRFHVPAGTVIPLTVQGVLEGLRKLPLHPPRPPDPGVASRTSERELSPNSVFSSEEATSVAIAQTDSADLAPLILQDRTHRTTARLRNRPAVEAVGMSQTTGASRAESEPPGIVPLKPFEGETALHFPSRLVMDVDREAGLDHATGTVTHNDHTELWHTRLCARSPSGELRDQPVFLRVRKSLEVSAAITDSAWKSRTSDETINNALRKSVRQGLVHNTGLRPVVAEQVTLSSLGAYLDVEGNWPEPTINGVATASLKAWSHQLELGRDVLVRTVESGILYPLGHTAMRIDTTERIFQAQNGQPAQLVTTSRIVVRQRDKTYINAKDDIERAWPWARVQILSRRTPPGSLHPVANASVNGVSLQAVLVMTGATTTVSPFEFRCLGVDRGGRAAEFELPLIFVPDGFVDLSKVEAFYTQPFKPPSAGGSSPTMQLNTIALRGQTISVAPVSDPAPDATDVIVETIQLTTPSKFKPGALAAARPIVQHIVGRIPAMEQLTKSPPVAMVIQFAEEYLKHEFGPNNVGEALLKLVPSSNPNDPHPLVDLANSSVTGGLIGPRFPLTGLSRKLGPVGVDLATLAKGKFSPTQLFGSFIDQIKLFGVCKLHDLLGKDTLQDIANAPKMVTKAVNGLSTPRLDWHTPLFQGIAPGGAIGVALTGIPASGQFRRLRDSAGADLAATLTLAVEVNANGTSVRQSSRCEITNIELVLRYSGQELVIVPLKRITFASEDNKKPDVDVDLGTIRFKGILAFVATLAKLIPADGFHDPPALDIRSDGVTSSFSLPVPTVAVGIFSLQNLSVHSHLDLFFAGDPPTFTLSFGRVDSPFRVTVSALGGGGYITVKVSTGGLVALAGALEFGAAVTIDLVVARGSVSAMGGLAFFLDGDGFARLTAYFTIRGELRVLGLITITIVQTIALGFESPPARLYGRAEIAVKIKMLFISKTVKFAIEKTFAGADDEEPDAVTAVNATAAVSRAPLGITTPPSFADLMGSGPSDATGWDTYCEMFAED